MIAGTVDDDEGCAVLSVGCLLLDSSVGLRDGILDVLREGSKDGSTVGSNDGLAVEERYVVGKRVLGLLDGIRVGLCVGVVAGAFSGSEEGLAVVRYSVGSHVGEESFDVGEKGGYVGRRVGWAAIG